MPLMKRVTHLRPSRTSRFVAQDGIMAGGLPVVYLLKIEGLVVVVLLN
jgi:hypothetical protein